MKVIITDAGRSKYFKAKNVGDCVTRAITLATNKDYKEVYDTIRKLSGKTARNGVSKSDTRLVMQFFGFKWKPLMEVGTGCKAHLKEGEIPTGTIICKLSGHVVCVKDNVIYDAFDPQRDGNRCVYGYWYK